MSGFQDFINVNKESINRTAKSLSKNWIVLFVGIVYGILNTLIYGLINTLFRGPLSIIAGFVGAFISAAMISNYLYMLDLLTRNSKVTIDDFKKGFTAYIYKVYGIMFIFYIVRLFLGVLNMSWVNLIVSFVSLILLNSLPETIYQKHYDANGSIMYSFEFSKDNIVNWYLPNLLAILILYILNSLFLPVFSLKFAIINLGTILIQALISLFMVYRGHLFNILSTSTKRKREFMSKF